MNVLVVEDEAIIAIELQRIAEEAGHKVLGPVYTIEQALFHAPRTDIALVDLGLADGASGPQLARRLIDRFGISVIFVTGSPLDVGTGREGAIAVVGKPFTDEQIAAALQTASESRFGVV
ncbi:response regulator [Oryzifoliimicrobium ureilyticus]|uniref:response regulator n=1 Tax=Oryzifoliimicrobium ureilyticus TaxID=3113724 RepID=UPI0030762F84